MHSGDLDYANNCANALSDITAGVCANENSSMPSTLGPSTPQAPVTQQATNMTHTRLRDSGMPTVTNASHSIAAMSSVSDQVTSVQADTRDSIAWQNAFLGRDRASAYDRNSPLRAPRSSTANNNCPDQADDITAGGVLPLAQSSARVRRDVDYHHYQNTTTTTPKTSPPKRSNKKACSMCVRAKKRCTCKEKKTEPRVERTCGAAAMNEMSSLSSAPQLTLPVRTHRQPSPLLPSLWIPTPDLVHESDLMQCPDCLLLPSAGARCERCWMKLHTVPDRMSGVDTEASTSMPVHPVSLIHIQGVASLPAHTPPPHQ